MITLELDKRVNGQFKNSKPEISDMDLLEATNINPANKVKWAVDVDAGKEKTIDYVYDFLRRR